MWHRENFNLIPTINEPWHDLLYHFLNIVTDDYKPDEDGDDDDDESCSSGVDENELEEDSHSEEDIDDIAETVLNV